MSLERLPWYSDYAHMEALSTEIDLKDWAIWFDGVDEALQRLDDSGAGCDADASPNMEVVDAGSLDGFVKRLEQKGDDGIERLRAFLISEVYGVPTTLVPTTKEKSTMEAFMAVCPRCQECGEFVPYAADEIALSTVCIPCQSAQPEVGHEMGM